MTPASGGRSENRPPVVTPAFVLLSVAHVLSTSSILALNLFPLFVERLGGSAFDMGLVMALGVVSGVLARPAIGRLMDAHGRVVVFVGCGLINAGSFLSYLAVSELSPLLYVLRLIHGVGIGGLFAAFLTSAADLIPDERRAEGLALFGISGIAAGGIGPFVGERLIAAGGFPLYFRCLSAIAGAALLGTLWLAFLTPLGRATERASVHMRTLILDPERLRLWTVVATFGFAIGGFAIFVAPHVAERDLASVTLFFAPYSASAVLLRILFRRLPERLGYRRSLGPALLSVALTALVLATDASDRGLVVAGLLGGIGHGFTFPILGAIAIAHAPRSERGAVVSVFTSAIDIGFLASGPALGWIAERGGYGAAFGACGFVSLVGIALFYGRTRTPATVLRQVP